jgi:hypothetical protein
MLAKKALLISVVLLLSIRSSGMAVMCARLSKVSAGEDHTLAIMDDNTLWACGGHISYYQLGLGGDVSDVYTLQQVKGENGSGHLKDIVAFDPGVDYCKSFRSRANAVFGLTPQALDQRMNSVISTRLLEVSQL